METPLRALAITPGILCLGLWSWGWIGAEPEVSHDQAPPAGPLQVAVPTLPETSSTAPERPSTPEPRGVVSDSPPPPYDAGPALTPELHRLRLAAQNRVLGYKSPGGSQAIPYAAIESSFSTACDSESEFSPTSPGTLALGHFLPIEHESALDSFHWALERLLAGQDDDGKVRILAYGASHTQADAYPGYLRAYLQARFGDGGRGFVALGRVNDWYRTLDTRVRHQSLAVHHARHKRDFGTEPLGLMGAALVGGDPNAFGEIVTTKDSTNTRFEVQYFNQPGGGDFDLYLDDRKIFRVETHAEGAAPAYRLFESTPGTHRIRAQLRGNGPVRLFGIVAETAAPGIVVDTLGLSGSRMAGNLHWDEETWFESVRHRSPDLVTFAYGTNEAADKTLSLESYERDLRAVLFRMRKALPLVSCVLIAPFDVPRAFRARLLQIAGVQRRVSRELGCGYWDGHGFMGGGGAIRRWVAVKPALASRDHIHLTPLGYVYAGIAIGDALMRAYDLSRSHSMGTTTGVTSSIPLLASPVESSGNGLPSMRMR